MTTTKKRRAWQKQYIVYYSQIIQCFGHSKLNVFKKLLLQQSNKLWLTKRQWDRSGQVVYNTRSHYLNPNLATKILSIGYLLPPSRDMIETMLKHYKFLNWPTTLKGHQKNTVLIFIGYQLSWFSLRVQSMNSSTNKIAKCSVWIMATPTNKSF